MRGESLTKCEVDDAVHTQLSNVLQSTCPEMFAQLECEIGRRIRLVLCPLHPKRKDSTKTDVTRNIAVLHPECSVQGIPSYIPFLYGTPSNDAHRFIVLEAGSIQLLNN